MTNKKLASKYFYPLFLTGMTITMPFFMSFVVTSINLHGFNEGFLHKWFKGYIYDILIAIPSVTICTIIVGFMLKQKLFDIKNYSTVYAITMTTFMSFVVSFILTLINFGIKSGFFTNWALAASSAFIVALPLSLVLSKFFKKIIYKFVEHAKH